MYVSCPFLLQIVKEMKPVVAASSHVLGNKEIDEGEELFCDYFFFSSLNRIYNSYFIKGSTHFLLIGSSCTLNNPNQHTFVCTQLKCLGCDSFSCLSSTETQNSVAMLLKHFAQQHEADFRATLTSLSEEQQAKVGAAISAS